MSELLKRLWSDAVFLLTVGATVFSAWEVADDGAPIIVNIAAAVFAALAGGYAIQNVRKNGT